MKRKITLAKGSIERHFYTLSDPRQPSKVVHDLINIIVIALCGVARGEDNFSDIGTFAINEYEWLSTFLDLPNGVPSHDTIERVFKIINPDEFSKCFIRWAREVAKLSNGEVVAIDGKTVRGSRDGEKSPIHIVSAWATRNHIVLGQKKVGEKTNEITAIPELLKLLVVKGCIVTTDAMGCQKSITAAIADAGADYVLALKENQVLLHEEVKTYFEDKLKENVLDNRIKYFETREKKHGREDIRRYYITEDIAWIDVKKDWTNLKSIGMVESERQEKGKGKSIERRYYICSLKDDACRFAAAVRGHWGIENSLHWVLDIVFREDSGRIRKDYAAENLSLIKKYILSRLKEIEDYPKETIRKKRKIAQWNRKFAMKLIFCELDND